MFRASPPIQGRRCANCAGHDEMDGVYLVDETQGHMIALMYFQS